MVKRLLFFIICCNFLLCGCATYYQVRVSGYLDKSHDQAPINAGSSFFVSENKNARNSIFESEVKSKIERLLLQRGFRIESYDKAQFYLHFVYSMDPGRIISETVPVYTPGGTGTIYTYSETGKRRTSIIEYPGYTTYMPYRRTIYGASLILEVFDASLLRNNKEEKKVWIGESFLTSQNPDMRDVISYLLIGSFEHFAGNTGKSIVTTLSENDPRIKTLLY